MTLSHLSTSREECIRVQSSLKAARKIPDERTLLLITAYRASNNDAEFSGTGKEQEVNQNMQWRII